MFQYTSTTLINENRDYTALPGAANSELFKALNGNTLSVKRLANFKKANVLAVYKNEAYDPDFAQVTIDLSKVPEATLNSDTDNATPNVDRIFRISLYIRLTDSQNSYYANDFVFKGKPFYIEAVQKANGTPEDLAAAFASNASKYIAMVYERPMLTVTANGAKVIINGTDEHQLFTKVDVEYYNPEGGYNFCCNASGEFENSASLGDTAVTLDKQGKPGFGTYSWILHNLRLPTAANTRWDRIIQDETPVLGAKYNQYTLYYCVNRGIMGGDAVGEVTKSRTTHVFYVNTAIAADFEKAITDAGLTLTEAIGSSNELPEPIPANIQAALDAKADKTTNP